MTLNGYMGGFDRIDEFDCAHEEYVLGKRNFEGKMSLEFFPKAKFVSNAWIKRV